MNTPRRGTQHTCRATAPPRTPSTENALVLVLMPDHDGPTQPIDAEELTDAYYECGERNGGCPPAVGSLLWKMKSATRAAA